MQHQRHALDEVSNLEPEVRIEPPDGKGPGYNRLVVATQHMNETKWRVFYGESRVVNSLLNWPLQRPASSCNKAGDAKAHEIYRQAEAATSPLVHIFRRILRVLVLAQWVLALFSAALQGWDAYIISFWVMFCVVSHGYLFSASRVAPQWLRRSPGVNLRLYSVRVSSRRALLSTLVTLNPDTFVVDHDEVAAFADVKSSPFMREGALAWLDPILKASPDRAKWLQATGLLWMMNKHGNVAGNTPQHWRMMFEGMYWWMFTEEGIEVCNAILKQANLLDAPVPPQLVKLESC